MSSQKIHHMQVASIHAGFRVLDLMTEANRIARVVRLIQAEALLARASEKAHRRTAREVEFRKLTVSSD